MIRPLTIVTCMLACGSGLYLYQSKHEVQLLDRTIERTVRDTNALRDQSRLLAAEWTMLNDPERLRQFSNAYLGLKTIAPAQFTSLADLDSRLPPPQAELPPHGTSAPDPMLVAGETNPPNPPAAPGPNPATSDAETAAPSAAADPEAVADQELPIPPVPATRPAIASVARAADAAATRAADARPADTRTADRASLSRPPPDAQSSAVVAGATRSPDQRTFDPRPSDQRPTDQRAITQRAAPRLAENRPDSRAPAAPPRSMLPGMTGPTQAATPVGKPSPLPPAAPHSAMVATSAPFNGSLLGMARSSMPPAPRPTPVTAAYNAN
ncbi:cell division protein FtsL [Rhodopila sp.]|uniref:cell division protein FtsL n=1 Tax=Rhodopila sp. TaxID=2480087 RepID=UPI003D122448